MMRRFRRDAAESKALLPGSSIAGALRAYLQTRFDANAATLLFGAHMSSEDSEGDQSAVLISDAISDQLPEVAVRDGVKIDGSTQTVSPGAKYDLELLPAGTTFKLRFELIEEVPFDQDSKAPNWNGHDDVNADRRYLLAHALSGLEQGSIALGMRKQRGLGECKIKQWQMWEFDMTNPNEMLAWLTFNGTQQAHSSENIAALLNVRLNQQANSHDCVITATFGFDQSLLIRSASDAPYTPDDVFLTTKSINGTPQPVIPVTSWAGVIRHRAVKIINTLGRDPRLIDALFGFVAEDTRSAKRSRIRINDSLIHEVNSEYVQTRIAIDRFTGAPYPGALLVEQPLWGNKNVHISLKMTLQPPFKKIEDEQKKVQAVLDSERFNAEVGLILLVLKDLWLGDLAVGGEQSIGRGTLRGKTLELTWDGKTSTIKQNNPNAPTLAIVMTPNGSPRSVRDSVLRLGSDSRNCCAVVLHYTAVATVR